MDIVGSRRIAYVLTVLGTVAALVVGCGAQSPAADLGASSPTGSPDVATAPEVGSRIDPRWMGLETFGGNWTVRARDVAQDRLRLDLQPSDETFEFPNECDVCNPSSTTAVLTVYARGAYDPAAVVTGEPVTVNGGEGFFLPPRWPAGAVLAWQYAKNAWATARGTSKTTGDEGRLLQLAAQVKSAERLPVRFPLSLTTLPADMPLSSIDSWGDIVDTRLAFDGCGRGMFEIPVAVCAKPSDRLTIRMVHSDEFLSYGWEADGRREVYTIPVKIGGRDGYVHQDRPTEAAIKVVPGLVVVFELSGPFVQDGFSSEPPTTRLGDVLASVVWAPDPANEATWPTVADWTDGT